MQDYIEYELEQYCKRLEQEEEMERLGFETVDEYYDYLADLEADYEIQAYEARMEL